MNFSPVQMQRYRFEFENRAHFKMNFGTSSDLRAKFTPSKHGYKHGNLAKEIVVVALNATKGVTRHALEWALVNVAHPGDSIVLLALLPPVNSSGWKFWQNNHNDSAAKDRKRLQEAKKSCQIMLEHLQGLSDARKVHTVVKLIPAAAKGVTTLEAKRLGATWVLLDRNLKAEEKTCIEQLECNLVIVKRNNAKILRLNLKQSPKTPTPSKDADFSNSISPLAKEHVTTPTSSPDVGTPFTLTDRGNSPASSSTSPFSSAEPSSTNSAHSNSNAADGGYIISESDGEEYASTSLRRSNVMDHSASKRHQGSESRTKASQMPPVAARQQLPSISRLSLSMRETGSRESLPSSSKPVLSSSKKSDVPSPRLILSDFLTSLRRTDSKRLAGTDRTTYDDTTATLQEHTCVRKAVSLSTHAPLGPPPLCSICQHKAPAFGRPPRAFTFQELELATGGFSQANFLAEGGFGSVHRGILPEGQVVAVKQHKLASSQGDVEFCSEVEVLSCAQHRNVVMLIGYCIEDSRRLLVYEYICNGSLDAHIYGRDKAPLEWQHRRKIAVGAARGLRYLHEECRVGCIVHRDMRPNNILLTHDYEPMVGDFGLARWQPDGELGVETRVIGTFGYLAPEYTQSGQITEKADVYSFGVVLLELVTGRKAIDIYRPKGQQCLTEWARTLLRKRAKREEMVDPKLEGCYDKDELDYMLHAASLCISRDPNTRPRMSQILRILEGDLTLEGTPVVGGSGRLSFDGGYAKKTSTSSSEQRRSISAFGGRNNNRVSSSSSSTNMNPINLSLEELKAAYRDKMAAAHGSRRLSLGDVLY